MYKIDYHIHTTLSPDGKASVEDQINAAIEAGLSEIAITDHCECNNNESIPPEFEPWFDFNPDTYIKTISKAEKAGIKVRTGIELGQATQNKEYADKILSYHEWDVVLGSLHNLKNTYDFYYLGLQNVDIRPLMKEYFNQLYELVCYNHFDVLAHLYYPIKYMFNASQELDIFEYTYQIVVIFKRLIENGKALEINTSALLSPYKNAVPQREFIKIYRDLGGELITIGSDSHTTGTVGLGVGDVIQMLKDLGFKAVTTYEKHKPIFIDI